jgi:mycofactocin precursor
VKDREETAREYEDSEEVAGKNPDILEEIEVEDYSVDGICGVY